MGGDGWMRPFVAIFSSFVPERVGATPPKNGKKSFLESFLTKRGRGIALPKSSHACYVAMKILHVSQKHRL